MRQLILRRLAQSVPLLLLISVVVFGLLHAVPGGPLAAYLENPHVRPEDIERLKRAMGLDRPLGVQYVTWLGAFMRGDWGFSYADGRPVIDRLLERVPATLELVGLSTLLSLLLALPVGVLAAVRRRFDAASAPAVTAGISLPVFWLGLVLQLVFAIRLGWLPSSGRQSFGATDLGDRLAHVILPAAVLAVVQGAAWSRYLRRAVRETMALPFLRAAQVRGLSELRLVLRHALPNALAPFVTVVLLDAAMLASGAVVTESVFAWPGVGSLFTEALVKRDYPVLMAFLMCGAVAVMVLNLVADLAVQALDPRSRATP
ncbi:MAG: ABC transporter permease [Gemmatimonas sp.]|jgi:peptide/nickel transport system permease protein|uniref:ABC transporter permease n=1 Tax=Gemmatimonas sp. TaxID=1962908 RepID=UPI00391F71C8|nr:ABC transporter permease [Gemmatimonadota bacterium]